MSMDGVIKRVWQHEHEQGRIHFIAVTKDNSGHPLHFVLRTYL